MKAAVVPRRRWVRPAVFGGLLAIAAATGAVLYLRRTKPLDCASASSRGELISTVVAVCEKEYRRTQLPATGVRLAEAMIRGGDRTSARTLLVELLPTEAQADVLYLRGQVDLMDGLLEQALQGLQEARKLHRAANQRGPLARDALALAGVHAGRDHFAEGLYALDECIVEAQAARAGATQGKCHVAAARTLTLVGRFDEARRELKLAEPLLSTDSDRAYVWLERGNIEQYVSLGRDRATNEERAVAAFERALTFATRARNTSLVLQAELNLTLSYTKLRKLDEAERHLALATELDRERRKKLVIEQLAAHIAYRRGHLELAFAQNERLYKAMQPGDERFEICVMQARIALARNDLAAAARWAQLGIDEAEKIRAAQIAVELRPWVLANRRTPYELLFAVHAREGNLEKAVEVFDRWQGRTILDAMSRPPAPQPLATTASTLQSLGRWLPAASTAPLVSAGGGVVAEALRSIDLLALAVVEGEVWRVIGRRGRLQIQKIDTLAALADRLDRFMAKPTDRAIAGEVGELLLPAELFGDASTLYVVLDAPFVGLPIVALRRDGKALIAARPVLRVPRLPTGTGTACATPTGAGSATVIADAKGDLPEARRESGTIAMLLGTTARLGADATSAALFAAKPDAVLHVAVHGDFDAGGGILRLHDRSVSALEVSASKLGPPLVVLSACSTAHSKDPELAGSLSSAFLANGSAHVIATLRPVSDEGALALTSRFYREGGVADPVRKLAAIQASLAGGDNPDWPSFAAFGTGACAPAAR